MESAKFKALLYADIFDYPLTEVELEKWKILDKLKLSTHNSQLSTHNTDGYYYLNGREEIVNLRKKREKISQSKFKKARQAASFLRKIPFIKMVGLTGGLTMNNCKEEDDIDLLMITQKGTLWLTRFLSTIILDLKGVRRKPNDKNFKDKICLNMFLEDSHLTLPKNEQDLYGAHEVCQVKPIFARDDTYQRFLKANSWARKFLLNAIPGIRNQELRIKGKQKKSLFILEELIKYLQLWYMKPHRTTEVISPHMLRFHPKDYRQKVMKEYQKRLKHYEEKI